MQEGKVSEDNMIEHLSSTIWGVSSLGTGRYSVEMQDFALNPMFENYSSLIEKIK